MIVIGHRGAAGYSFENSASSFKKAVQLGVDYIETDLHVLKDGTVVCVHDHVVNRVTNGKGHVAKYDIASLKALQLHNGDHIVTLDELLILMKKENKKYKKHVRLNLEIKSKKAVVPTIMKLKNYIVKKDWQVDDFLITSFDYGLLRMVKELLPEIRIGLLSIFPPFHYIGQAQSLQAYSLHPYSFFVRNWIVANAHKHGLLVMPYTVNNPKEIKRLNSIGVDGIISDFPDRVRKVEGNMKYYGL